MDRITGRASDGGKARAAKLTPEQRSESARHAVRARWAKRRRPAMAEPGTTTGHAGTVIGVTIVVDGKTGQVVPSVRAEA